MSPVKRRSPLRDKHLWMPVIAVLCCPVVATGQDVKPCLDRVGDLLGSVKLEKVHLVAQPSSRAPAAPRYRESS